MQRSGHVTSRPACPSGATVSASRSSWTTPSTAPGPSSSAARGTSLRSVFLGDPSGPESGIVELVELDGMAPPVDAASAPVAGFFLLSLYADLDAVLPRLAGLGLGGEPVVAPVGPVRLAVLHDPNGVRVELMDTAAQATMASLTEARP